MAVEQRMVQPIYFWVNEPVYESPAVSYKTFNFVGLNSAVISIDQLNLQGVDPESVEVFFNGRSLVKGTGQPLDSDVTDIVRSGTNNVQIYYTILFPMLPQGRVTIRLDVDAIIAGPAIPEIPWEIDVFGVKIPLLPFLVIGVSIPISYVGATAIADWFRGR